MPPNKRCVKCKWVFKKKSNGIYRARNVACGYSQIPNIDFTDSFSPVINDMSWKILIIICIIYELDIRLLDVETAFQHGELDVEIFMEPPEGIEDVMELNRKEECMELLACTYGLVQASRQYRKKFVQVMKSHGVNEIDADPCLMIKLKDDKPILYVGTHVDDSMTVGKIEDINEMVKHMEKEGLTTKCEELKEYLGCNVVFSQDRKKAWLGQTETVKKLEREFGEDVKKLRKYTVAGTPGVGILRPKSEEEKVNDKDQSRYRSGVGMLLWIMKCTRPDISNAVRELTKVMDGATEEAMKEMLRVIKFVLDTRNIGLKIEPKLPKDFLKEFMWILEMFSDSDWAGDKDNRRSISGFILFLFGVPISYKSRQQKTVSLSSAEAEWIALSEAIREILFAIHVLEGMKIAVKKPVIVRVDNMGAIFMAKNTTATKRTKHIDIKAHFVHEHVNEETGQMEIVFVRSEENKSDIFTKNVPRETMKKQSEEYLGEEDEIHK